MILNPIHFVYSYIANELLLFETDEIVKNNKSYIINKERLIPSLTKYAEFFCDLST